MTIKPLLTTLASTFAGGAGGFVSTHLSSGVPNTAQAIEAFALGAFVAGVAALVHLYQAKPGGIDAGINAADAASARGAP